MDLRMPDGRSYAVETLYRLWLAFRWPTSGGREFILMSIVDGSGKPAMQVTLVAATGSVTVAFGTCMCINR